MIASNGITVTETKTRDYPCFALATGDAAPFATDAGSDARQIVFTPRASIPDLCVRNPGDGTGKNPKHILNFDDELFFPKSRRVFKQYFTDAMGARQLHLYFGDSSISFEDPEQFGFGEGLAIQSTFKAGAATSWGVGYRWVQVLPLLEQLLEEGVLRHAQTISHDPNTGARLDGARPSMLPPAPSPIARTWFECEAITQELTGRALEIGHLELVVPIFRVAHMAMDAEGRQVGEANVFPKALRVDVQTNWRQCIYQGSRFQAEVPMNVSALKSMRTDWAQMMAVLLQIREAYLSRFPEARTGWTVGHLERLSTVVLALPTYLLMRVEKRVENGNLHPALSCLFRVTDGLRLTMHQMLFVPIGEAALSPEAPITSTEVFAYAERNYAFHSEHGVCAGPKIMIEEFLNVVIDGHAPRTPYVGKYDPAIQAALDDLDAAFDYAMYGLQNYATIFSVWPVMTRTYEELFGIVDAWAGKGSVTVVRYRDKLAAQIDRMRTRTYLATEEWRVHRELAYGDMYAQCALGLRAGGKNAPHSTKTLAAQIGPQDLSGHGRVALQLADLIRKALGFDPASDAAEVGQLASCMLEFFIKKQAILRVASDTQGHLNSLLGRTPPARNFTAADIDIHNLLQQLEERTLPYLLDELQDLLNVNISIDQDTIEIENRIVDGLIQPSTFPTHSTRILQVG